MSDTDDYLINYIKASKENNHEDMIKILTAKITSTSVDNKDGLIILFIDRVKAFFHNKKYNDALSDCMKLTKIGYKIDDNEEIKLIEIECRYRVESDRAVCCLNTLSIKFENHGAAITANKIEGVDIDKIFKKNEAVQRQGSIKRTK